MGLWARVYGERFCQDNDDSAFQNQVSVFSGYINYARKLSDQPGASLRKQEVNVSSHSFGSWIPCKSVLILQVWFNLLAFGLLSSALIPATYATASLSGSCVGQASRQSIPQAPPLTLAFIVLATECVLFPCIKKVNSAYGKKLR